MVLSLHERNEQEFGGYKAEDRKLIQSSNVIGTSTSRTELDMFHVFLEIRRALNNSKRLLSFSLERDLSRGGGERRDGDPSYFSLARACSCARIPFPVPFRRRAIQTILFLDVDVICAPFLSLDIIER